MAGCVSVSANTRYITPTVARGSPAGGALFPARVTAAHAGAWTASERRASSEGAEGAE